MDFGVPSGTKPSAASISFAVMVIPGWRSFRTMRPSASVVYSPLVLPTAPPSLPVMRKRTPGIGVVVPATYLVTTSVESGAS